MKGRRVDWKKSGIYSIICAINGKQYIGQTKNIYRRINLHKCRLNQNNTKHANQHFIKDWNEYGSESFDYIVLEYTSEDLINKEFEYINKLDTINREKGYNLRRDSTKTGMLHLDETRKRYSTAMKLRFTRESERIKQSIWAKNFWKNNPKKKEIMKEKVSKAITKYTIKQYDKSGNFIKEWNRVKDIIKENPTYKVHNIYAVCSGEKPSIYGYVWTKCKIKI